MVAALDICGVSLNFESLRVLDGLSFTVNEGDFLTILGPNGSGKSTLLKLLAKTLAPTGGAIYFAGEDLKNLSSSCLAKHRAVVPQQTAVNFPFTVHEVVMMGRAPHLKRFQTENRKDYEIVREAMMAVKVWDLRERLVTELSGGELQRVIIARALAQQPKVILLDEPTAHLDISFQVELLELLTFLNKEKKITVIIVLHDLNLAAQYSQKVLILHRGKIFAMGTPEEVITAENIKKVYDTRVIISQHPVKSCPQVSILGKETKTLFKGKTFRVHLICGGGVGANLLNDFQTLGCEVSTGVLNIGDSDWVYAKKLGIDIVEEVPYSPIGEKAFHEAKHLAGMADLVVVTEFPIGPGNVKNILVAAEALRKGIPTYVVAKDIEKRDYTGGQGVDLISQLCSNGAVSVETGAEVIEIIKQRMRFA